MVWKRGLNFTEGSTSSKSPKMIQHQETQKEDEPNNDVIVALSTFKRPLNGLQELFNHWRNFLIQDSFTGTSCSERIIYTHFIESVYRCTPT